MGRLTTAQTLGLAPSDARLWFPGAARAEMPWTRRRLKALNQLTYHTMVGDMWLDTWFRSQHWCSTLVVRLDGTARQHRPAGYASGATIGAGANDISVETGDHWTRARPVVGPWTDAQIETLTRIAVWAYGLGIDPPSVTGSACHPRGIAYHARGIPGVYGAAPDAGLCGAWSKAKGKNCPTQPRIDQVVRVIVPALAARIAGSPPASVPDVPRLLKLTSPFMRGADVLRVQQYLKVTPADSVYGPATNAAVVAFQRARKLTADGVVGPATLKAMSPSPAPKPTPAPAPKPPVVLAPPKPIGTGTWSGKWGVWDGSWRLVEGQGTRAKPSPAVRELQRALNSVAHPVPALVADGLFGPATTRALAAWQRSLAAYFNNSKLFAPDAFGVAGKETRGWLSLAVKP